MRLRQRYLGALLERLSSSPGAEVSPSLMCQACVDVLPVDGAGISLTGKQLRVPLGWSSGSVGTAERAQTTVGAGPCLSAAESGSALAADSASIAERWPVYCDELFSRTPFRSVASVPLQVGDEAPLGALDLYASHTDLSEALALDDVSEAVAGPIAEMLSGTFRRLYDEDVEVPEWLTEDPAVERMTVWTAVGMLVAASGLTDADALGLLRAWAYSRGHTLDEVAASVADRETPAAVILAGT